MNGVVRAALHGRNGGAGTQGRPFVKSKNWIRCLGGLDCRTLRCNAHNDSSKWIRYLRGNDRVYLENNKGGTQMTGYMYSVLPAWARAGFA